MCSFSTPFITIKLNGSAPSFNALGFPVLLLGMQDSPYSTAHLRKHLLPSLTEDGGGGEVPTSGALVVRPRIIYCRETPATTW